MAVAVASTGRSCRLLLALGLLSALAGCAATGRPHLKSDLQPPNAPEVAAGPLTAEPAYAFSCPDVLEIQVAGRPEYSGRFTITPEGRINLGALGEPRVEGDTEDGLARRVAGWAGVPSEQVRCRVVEFRSRLVYIFGPVRGPSRSVPYRGPETVLALLRRAGGLARGAALRNVNVVRPNVDRDLPPQVFPVDLPAILYRNDTASNVVLQPFDEVYVGETRRAVIGRALPKWMLPAFHNLCRLWGGCPVAFDAEPAGPGR